MKLVLKGIDWWELGSIVKIGLSGAILGYYISLRGFIVNGLITTYVGGLGISAFVASDSVLQFFWAIPAGMLAVSRMMISVSVGEEDKHALKDVMRTVLFRFAPLMCVVSVVIIALAVPFTSLYFRDPSQSIYGMTVAAFRILPLCMPLSMICAHFICYWVTTGRHFMVHFMSILDGVVCVSAYTAILLIAGVGMNGVYIVNVLNGVTTTLVIVIYACIKNRGFPKNMDEFLVIPKNFGVEDKDRLDFVINGIEDVVGISEEIHTFCRERNIDEKRAFSSSLALEEMAGNVVTHGFHLDDKKHHAFARAILKDGDVILCIKDDCKPFDPVTWRRIASPEDQTSNIGLRIVSKMAKSIDYQNIFGLNVLTIRV